MPSASAIAHSGLTFANPMSEAAVDAAVAALPLPSDAFVLDTGCADGDILLRVLRRHHGARGLGVDLDPDAISGPAVVRRRCLRALRSATRRPSKVTSTQ